MNKVASAQCGRGTYVGFLRDRVPGIHYCLFHTNLFCGERSGPPGLNREAVLQQFSGTAGLASLNVSALTWCQVIRRAEIGL